MGRSIRLRVALGLTIVVLAAGGMTMWLYRAVGDAAALAQHAAEIGTARRVLLELERIMAQAHLEIGLRAAGGHGVPAEVFDHGEQAFEAELRQRFATSADPDEIASLRRLGELGRDYFRAARAGYLHPDPGAADQPSRLLGLRRDMVGLVAERSAALASRQASAGAAQAAGATRDVQRQVMALAPAFVGLAVLVGVFLLRSATRPLRALGVAITQMAAGHYAYRLPEAGPEEFVAIARRFNSLAEERQAVETDRARLGQAIEQAAEAVLVTDPDGRIVYVNPAFERVSGYSRAEALGMTPRIVHSGRNDPAVYRDLWSTIRAGETWKGELVNRHRDGSFYVERQTISPIRDSRGYIEAFVSIGADVTTERRLEAQVTQSAKMEAVGRLAGGVAHDFNNLLMVITGSAEKLRRAGAAPAEAEAVDAIARAADQAAALTSRLLAFSRQQTLAPRPTNLNDTVRGIEEMLRRLIGEDIQMLTCTTQELPAVLVDPGQAEQIVMNLAVNARDAMPSGGRLLLETAVTEVAAHDARAGDRVPGTYVRLTVSDTGIGMDAETQRHLFEPFYTTKPVGKGTGLGLSTVYGIVHQAGGHIDVASEPGRGTSFSILLPACRDRVEPAAPPAADLPAVRGQGTVLVAEDDADVRDLLRGVFADAGYSVVVAADGAAALAAAARVPSLDLLVTDMVMPGMRGVDLAWRLWEARPALRVIYLTGYAPAGPEGRLVPGARFLQKPVSFALLNRTAAELLGTVDPARAAHRSRAV
ncbi:MAG: ATP-binding protein [Vicinamibacterales bacterium]